MIPRSNTQLSICCQECIVIVVEIVGISMGVVMGMLVVAGLFRMYRWLEFHEWSLV